VSQAEKQILCFAVCVRLDDGVWFLEVPGSDIVTLFPDSVAICRTAAKDSMYLHGAMTGDEKDVGEGVYASSRCMY
jgi:hypothetical protein